MDTKRLGRIDIKDEAKGEFSAVIATYGVIDSDGDVTLPGAHQTGQKVVVSDYGHSATRGRMPVGSGVIRAEKSRTIVTGAYFMDVPEARSAFVTMKRLHEDGIGEWSYGYDVIDSEMGVQDGQRVRFLKEQNVFEVSHVLRGAGVGTRTLAAKSDTDGRRQEATVTDHKTAIRPHTATWTDRAWDGPAMLAAVPEKATVSDLRSVFAGVDAVADPEAKDSYLFAHHHGVDGPVNLRACVYGIAALNRDTAMAGKARDGIYEHLAGHLRDADREPPGLLAPGDRPKNIDRLTGLLDELAVVVGDIRDVGSSRSAKGKKLSSYTFEVLGWAEEDLDQVAADVKRLLSTPRDAAATEYVRFIAQQFRAAG